MVGQQWMRYVESGTVGWKETTLNRNLWRSQGLFCIVLPQKKCFRSRCHCWWSCRFQMLCIYCKYEWDMWISYRLYAFFWVIPRHLNFICQHFGTLCLFRLHRQVWRQNRQSVLKRRHIKLKHQGITQNKAYNVQNTAKVWNQELIGW
jgi:hypothetical protein